MKKYTYKDSGVDIAKGEEAISNIKDAIKTTFSKNVLGTIGGFGGMFEVPEGYKRPVLVSSTDGVGTKLRVAVMAQKHDTVGEDLVNHCINDIAVLGAKPLYFLDYFATARLDETVFNAVLTGFIRGCKNSGVSLIGGETAEMPGIYNGDDYDLCGTIVGIIEKENIIDGRRIKKGDILVGLASQGLHTNGYSLARKVLFEDFTVDSFVKDIDNTIGAELLKVHRCYLNPIQAAISKFQIKGISHITGGGIVGNTSRVLPEGLKLQVDWGSWHTLPIFDLIQETGSVPVKDMRRTFNLGIGLIFIVDPDQADELTGWLNNNNEKAWKIGSII
ncbi:MAG: phosphoribosylformylglycinamidine cyclo-ligase [Calditrichae bacterium]|nr:phosphoribosylformylglycinamidine cyclo-ligase [Calditrichota bacterium]MCB9057204.1 phosphoribosylformylglycinamidine cyclo-ligase [Calditrichia bacterium]